MTRAAENLYASWDKPIRREGLFASRRFWIGFLVMTAIIIGSAFATRL